MEFKYPKGRIRSAGILALALLFMSGVAFGQAQTGNIFAKASDEQGAGLPGVMVTLSGVGASLSQVTNTGGEVRFLSLGPGTYALNFALQGFGKVSRTNVTVAVGANTSINVTMKLAGVQESVVVAGESPLLDTRKTGSQTTVSTVELASVPTARDPWVVLQTAPGVQIDRVNVGGSESGQQSQYVGKGSGTAQGTWNIDGINITDMAALGSSAAYYDFDSFAELNIATGGADVSISTPGVQLNMVTKRGTNDLHGSARVYYESKKTSSTNVTDEVLYDTALLGHAPGSGNTVDQLQDYGAELGGPVVKDMLWLWGSYGRNSIDLVVPGGATDKTVLFDYGFKLNLQAVPENTLTAQFLDNDKQKFGRNASPQRPQPTTWDQTGPTKIYKIEDSHIFSPNVFATASYARVLAGFSLIPEGSNQTFNDANGVWANSYLAEYIQRPQTQASITPSFFFRSGNVGHELKAGFVYRYAPVTTTTAWPTGIIGAAAGSPWTGLDEPSAEFTRPGESSNVMKYYSAFLSDTLTMNKLTLNIGVRYDRVNGENQPFQIPCCLYGSANWPQVPMTSLDVPGTAPLKLDAFAPRIGASYAIDDKTVARLSYARFISQLGSGTVGYNSASPSIAGTYLYYGWNDKNGNNRVDPGEVDFNNLQYYYHWDPAHPNSVTSSINQIDYGMKPPKTDEFVLGFEREVLPAFVVGATGTYRRLSDFIFTDLLSADGSRVLNPSDFVCTQSASAYVVPGVGPESVTVCNPKKGVAGVGHLEHNRPGYYQTYWGIDFSAVKRYSDKWLARFNFTYSDWTQHGLAEGQVDPSNLVGGSEAEGGPLMPSSTASGAKGYVFINSKWQGTLSAMYTLPLEFNLSTSIFARQGYPVAYYALIASSNLPGIASKSYQLGAADDVRLPTVFEWDLGLAKVVRTGPLAITLQADCFNVLNSATVLQRYNRIRSTTTAANTNDNYIQEIQSPRIFRLGVRLGF